MSVNSSHGPHGGQLGLAGSTASGSRAKPASSLSSLVHQANALSQNNGSDLPQIRYGLDEIERLSDNISARPRGSKVQGEGHSLLSHLGVNTSQLAHHISSLPSGTTAGTSKPRRRRIRAPRSQYAPESGSSHGPAGQDVSSWGRNWHETIILSGIEYQRQRTVKSFNEQFQSRILANWEADKARILQDELGVTDDEIARIASSGLGASTLGKSTLGASTRRFPQSQGTISAAAKEGEFVMHTKMVRYETVVTILNSKRLRKEPFELCQAFEGASKGDAKFPLLPTAFRILAHLTAEPSVSDAPNAEPIQERQYAGAYLGGSRSHTAGLLRGRLSAGGRRFLEKDFEVHMDELIAKHPKEAALGGIPGITNKVRAYVGVLLRTQEAKDAYRPETVDDKLLYAQVYYLLRSGYATEALELLSAHQNSLKREDYSLPGAFKSYLSNPDRRISKQQRDALYSDFNGYVRTNPNVDQFKYALYKIIGRFELSRKSAKVAATTEDWIWLNLTLVRDARGAVDDGPQDAYNGADFGNIVLKFGAERFDANGTRPFTWFNLLLLAGEFELALGYLYTRPQLRTDAVHFAIVLQYYGLLRLTQPEDTICVEGDEISKFNFARAIKSYIAPFARVEPQTALQYAYLVALGSDASDGVGEAQKPLALELVRDVVLASKAWSKLLGSVRADGTKEPGIIERDSALLRLNASDDFLRHVVLSAAEQSAVDASLTDSIELYHLAGAPDKVIESVNRALGASLSIPGGLEPISSGSSLGISGAFGGASDLLSLASRVHDVYEKDYSKKSRVAKAAWDTLGLLLQLKLALAQFASDRPDSALETLRSTGILPLDSDPASIPRSTIAFKALLDQPTIASLDTVVVTAMKCLHLLSQHLKASPYGDQGRMAQIQTYKLNAQALVQFASGLRLRLGPDVYRQLSSMSAFF